MAGDPDTATSPLIETQGLRLAYGRRTILDQVQLQVRAGEFWFFLGTNGTGKTTLLRAILGVLPPAGGRLHVQVPRPEIGFVPQRCDFNPTLPTTVREFVSLGLVGVAASVQERRQRLDWALTHVGLQALTARSYWAMSGGERQRALVARALIRKPRLLLADEPTSGLDVQAQDRLLHCLVELNRTEGITLIFVSHDLSHAACYSSHIALFHEGKVIAGPRAEVLTAANLQTVHGLSVNICNDIVSLPNYRNLTTRIHP